MKILVLCAILVICPKDVKSLKCTDSFGLGYVSCISVVDGSWSQWGSWSTCDSTCSRSRTRQCTDPKPENGGKDCQGVPKETERCTGGLCVVDGSWSQWGSWSTCDSTCSRSRTRQCTDPKPQNGGKDCAGVLKETEQCTGGLCVVDGSWSQWGSWSTCVSTCSRSRTRQCTDPKPQNGGKDCEGVPKETERCTGGLCDPCQTVDALSCNINTGKCVKTGSTWRCDCKQFFQNQPGNNQICISIFKAYRTWVFGNKAEEECEKRGGYLATIFSQAENDALMKYLHDESVHNVWIGLTQTSRDQYKWVTGETIQINLSTGDAANHNEYANFAKWQYGFEYDKDEYDQRNCIYMSFYGTWCDDYCKNRYYYVCKIIYK